MEHGICFQVMITDEEELKLAEAEGYNGMVSVNDVMWSGPLAIGDRFVLRGFGEDLVVQKLLHYPGGTHPVCEFEHSLTDVFVSTSKKTIDRLLATMPEAWEKREL